MTKTATTEADGVKTYTCTVCQATKTEAIPALVSDAGSDAPASEPNPATGDSASLMLLGALMLLSVTGTVFVVKKKILVK